MIDSDTEELKNYRYDIDNKFEQWYGFTVG